MARRRESTAVPRGARAEGRGPRGEGRGWGGQRRGARRADLEAARVLGAERGGQHVLEGGDRVVELGPALAQRAEVEAVLVVILRRAVQRRAAVEIVHAAQVLDGRVVHRLVLHVLDGELHAVALQRLPRILRRSHPEGPVHVRDRALCRLLLEHRVRRGEGGRAERRVQHHHRRALGGAAVHVVAAQRRHVAHGAILRLGLPSRGQGRRVSGVQGAGRGGWGAAAAAAAVEVAVAVAASAGAAAVTVRAVRAGGERYRHSAVGRACHGLDQRGDGRRWLSVDRQRTAARAQPRGRASRHLVLSRLVFRHLPPHLRPRRQHVRREEGLEHAQAEG